MESIKLVLQNAGKPLTLEEILKGMTARNLYPPKAADPKSVIRSQLRRRCIGLVFAKANPVKYFRLMEEDKYAIESISGARFTRQARFLKRPQSMLLEEIMENAQREHLSALRQEHKQKLLEKHPAFFERLVIDLLIKMRDSGSDPNVGIHTGRPDDGGIDDIIKEEYLGWARFTSKPSATHRTARLREPMYNDSLRP